MRRWRRRNAVAWLDEEYLSAGTSTLPPEQRLTQLERDMAEVQRREERLRRDVRNLGESVAHGYDEAS